MRTTRTLAIVAVFVTLIYSADEGLAVDKGRVNAQTRLAPEWARSAGNAASADAGAIDPGFNSGGDPAYKAVPATPAIRDRSTAAGPSAWPNSPSLFDDPLRRIQSFSQSYGDPYESNLVDQSPTRQRWRLGIYPDDTETGVQITQVVRGSAAERAGLEVNDRLVSIHGYQVGYVDGVLYDCAQEFERRADANGWVRALVQDNRNGTLINLPIQLDPRYETISGTVAYRDRDALPRNAQLTVELRELVRSDLQPITVTRQTFTASRTPIPFELEYDPTQVDLRRRYVLHAVIASAGQHLYTLQQPFPILDGGRTEGVQLLVNANANYPGDGSQPDRNAQLTQITQWFRDYLGREPRTQERYVWESHLARGGSLTDAQLHILSMPEFYFQSNADDAEYVRRMFHLVANRPPSQQEVSQWVARLLYHNRLRSEMAREFLAMANSQAANARRR